MSVLKITGGKPLVGEVSVGGSKNAALAILSSLPLVHGTVTLTNLPKVSDIRIKLELLKGFGAEVDETEDGVRIGLDGLHYWEPEEEKVRKIRTGFYLLGPLLARMGHAKLPMPGGCNIGARPVDFHVKGLNALGAEVKLVGGHYVADAPDLKGAEIYLDSPSAGATQHLMATASLVEGHTVIQNASIEPEVIALAMFLQAVGAKIEGAGSSTITVTGVSRLEGRTFRVPADRIQAATYLLAGAITGGDVKITGILPENQTALVNKLKEAGLESEDGSDWIRVWATTRPSGIKIKTMPYPGFPTDVQQPMAALLTLANGLSVVEETVYESRIGHVAQLARMGAKIQTEGRTTVIEGVESLEGTVVEASDLRAGASLCLAGLAARGETIVKNVHYIDRGYEDLEATIASLGGQMERLEHEPERALTW